MSSPRVGKLQPAACFCKIIIIIIIMFDWNTDMPIHLGVACGCFPATTAELSRCHRAIWLSKLRIFTIRPFSEKVCQNPDLVP